MSSAAQPVEIIPDHRENRSGLLRKPFAFSPGIPFTFSPESCSPSPRNVFHVPAGIAFTLPRNPHGDPDGQKKLDTTENARLRQTCPNGAGQR
jgi:hypothetical protein